MKLNIERCYELFKKYIFIIFVLNNSLFVNISLGKNLSSQEIKSLEVIAKNGNTDAQLKLGKNALIHIKPPDYATAAFWFKKASKSGNMEAKELLAAQKLSGLGTPPDLPGALSLFKEAANSGSPNAQASLGVMYAIGAGVKKDKVNAYAWLTIAAYNGLKEARTKRDNSVLPGMTAAEVEQAIKLAESFLKK